MDLILDDGGSSGVFMPACFPLSKSKTLSHLDSKSKIEQGTQEGAVSNLSFTVLRIIPEECTPL